MGESGDGCFPLTQLHLGHAEALRGIRFLTQFRAREPAAGIAARRLGIDLDQGDAIGQPIVGNALALFALAACLAVQAALFPQFVGNGGGGLDGRGGTNLEEDSKQD